MKKQAVYPSRAPEPTRPRVPSIQETKVTFSDIGLDAIHLPGGGARAVIEVAAVNLALRSPAERDSTVDAFRAFLNGLAFPIQVLVRVERLDVEGYLASLGYRLASESDPGLRRLGVAQLELVRELASTRVLLGRRFFVIVPVEEVKTTPSTDWLDRLRPKPRGQAAGRPPYAPDPTELAARATAVVRGLATVGLRARRLTTAEILDLYYAVLCPTLAHLQPLPRGGRSRVGAPGGGRKAGTDYSNEGGIA